MFHFIRTSEQNTTALAEGTGIFKKGKFPNISFTVAVVAEIISE
jgi:hypothetical protein